MKTHPPVEAMIVLTARSELRVDFAITRNRIEAPPSFTGILAACAATLLAILWGVYQLRVRQSHRQFNLGLKANAIRHAEARRIEVKIRYHQEQLRLRIRDDGKGIDLGVLDKEHLPGHWGLRGMRERANLIGGSFEVWSEIDSGTEVELSIPAANAYSKPVPRLGFDLRSIKRS